MLIGVLVGVGHHQACRRQDEHGQVADDSLRSNGGLLLHEVVDEGLVTQRHGHGIADELGEESTIGDLGAQGRRKGMGGAGDHPLILPPTGPSGHAH